MSDFVLASRSTGPNVTDYALASFLARYRGSALRAYKQDLLAFLRWCAARQLAPLEAKRPHLELYLRWMEQEQLAQATIGRRFGTVAGFFQYTVVDGHLADNPALAVTRPRVSWEGQRRTVLHPLEYAALLTAARHDGPQAHALVAILGMLGLRISEACRADITDLGYHSGYELLQILGKGHKPATIPLPVPVLRAIHDAIKDRQCGPILLNTHSVRMSPASAAGHLQRLAKTIGIEHTPSARTACDGCSAPPASSPVSPSETCSTPCGTPTRAPPCGSTWPAPTSTDTRPTPSPPTSPAWPWTERHTSCGRGGDSN